MEKCLVDCVKKTANHLSFPNRPLAFDYLILMNAVIWFDSPSIHVNVQLNI